MKCISCNYEHEENFCPNCGEKSNVDKITFTSMLRSTFLSITNMDKGFLYNLKHLTLNPRNTILDYISGKRKAIYNPITFLLISITIYIIITDQLWNTSEKIVSEEINRTDPIAHNKLKEIANNAGYIIHKYLKYFWIFTIILLANTTKLIFRRFNYAEHLTISAFIIGYATLVGLIGFFIFDWILIFNPIVFLTILFLVYKFFNNKNEKILHFIMACLSLFLFFIQFFIIIFGAGLLAS